MATLNQSLIVKQGLTQKDILELEHLHGVLDHMVDEMHKLDPSKDHDKVMLRLFADLLESLEFNMQRVWKFPQDRDYHSWWYKVPHCTCPKMDNADYMYRGRRIINQDCPVHGVSGKG